MSDSVLAYLTQAEIRDSVRTLQGKMLTAPALVRPDGTNLSYAANVEISTEPADLALDLGSSLVANPTQDQILHWAWTLGIEVPDNPTPDQMTDIENAIRSRVILGDVQNRILYNVPVAQGNRDLIYANAGMAVTLTRSQAGTFEISGFATNRPGTRTRVAVHLGTVAPGDGSPGTPPTVLPGYDVTLNVHQLTLDDMGDPAFAAAGWGSMPLGSYAVYRGSALVAVGGTAVDPGGPLTGGGTGTSPPGVAPPTIQAFTTSSSSVASGTSVTLTWTVLGATNVSIGPAIGTVPVSGSRAVTPFVSTSYTLTATNGNGTVTASVTVTVTGGVIEHAALAGNVPVTFTAAGTLERAIPLAGSAAITVTAADRTPRTMPLLAAGNLWWPAPTYDVQVFTLRGESFTESDHAIGADEAGQLWEPTPFGDNGQQYCLLCGNRSLVSTDGISWTVGTLMPGRLQSTNVYGLAWAADRWVACYDANDYYGEHCFLTSQDGLNWTEEENSPLGTYAFQFVGYDYDSGRLLGMRTNREVWASDDKGATWSQLPTTFPQYEGATSPPLAYNGNWYVGCRSGIRVSSDGGATWTLAFSASSPYAFIETVVRRPGGGIVGIGQRCCYSLDGAAFSEPAVQPGVSFGTAVGSALYACSDWVDGWKSTDGGATWISLGRIAPNPGGGIDVYTDGFCLDLANPA